MSQNDSGRGEKEEEQGRLNRSKRGEEKREGEGGRKGSGFSTSETPPETLAGAPGNFNLDKQYKLNRENSL